MKPAIPSRIEMLRRVPVDLVTTRELALYFSQISKAPFAKLRPFKSQTYDRLRAGGFVDWRLRIDGMAAQPAAFSLDELRSFPPRSQITHLACEEGWSFIAEWTGVPLSYILRAIDTLPQARYVVYFSLQPKWSQSIDMDDALHPQTPLVYGMNGGGLPIEHGGPLRLRVARQLGYKSVKSIHRLIVTDSLKQFHKEGATHGTQASDGAADRPSCLHAMREQCSGEAGPVPPNRLSGSDMEGWNPA